MPEFTTVSVKEAQLRTIPGRQGKFISEYADYIQQLPKGQAGKLTIGEGEKHTAIRRRLVTTAKTMNIPLIVKRSGNDLYFWRDNGQAEQPMPRRGRRSRNGRPGSLLPPTTQFGASAEDSPKLGQTDQVVEDAMRRVDPE